MCSAESPSRDEADARDSAKDAATGPRFQANSGVIRKNRSKANGRIRLTACCKTMVWEKVSNAASNFGKGNSNFGKLPDRPPPQPSRVEDVFGKFYVLVLIGSILLFLEKYLISHINFIDISPYRAKLFFGIMGLFLVFFTHSLRKDFAILYRYSVRRARTVGAVPLIGAGCIWMLCFIVFVVIINKYSIEQMFDLADLRIIEFSFLLMCFCILSIIMTYCLMIARSRGIKLD